MRPRRMRIKSVAREIAWLSLIMCRRKRRGGGIMCQGDGGSGTRGRLISGGMGGGGDH